MTRRGDNPLKKGEPDRAERPRPAGQGRAPAPRAEEPRLQRPAVDAPQTDPPIAAPPLVPPDERARRLRWTVYTLLIALAAGNMLGRVLAVNSVDKIALEKRLQGEGREDWRQQRPFLSANDRSRWLTVRALVEQGTYAIDAPTAEPNWDTIDMVRHDGKLYSSKPPLLATLMAGEYWLIHKATGWTLGDHPYEIGRFMVVTINVLPLLAALWLLAGLVERFGTSDWGRALVITAAALGTFLTTFAVVVNNHLIAAVCVAFALSAAVPIWFDGERRWRYFAVAGFFAAFAAANELPALAFTGLLGLALLYKDRTRTLLAGLPAALVVAAAFFGTNWLAVGSLRPPYAHRGDGPEITVLADSGGQAAALDAGRLPAAMRNGLKRAGIDVRADAEVRVVESGQRWSILDDEDRDERMFAVRQGNSGRLHVHAWDNWYDYRFERGGKVRDSYWRTIEGRSPVDKGEASRGMYILHCLVGHHGIFSLSPIWLLAVAGVVIALRRPALGQRGLAALVAITTLACLAFYFSQGQENRNYGGGTSGLRWMFWFAPLWLVAMCPAADAASRHRWSRGLALVLLVLSVLSASYPTWNPWVHPWLVNWFNYLGWSEL